MTNAARRIADFEVIDYKIHSPLTGGQSSEAEVVLGVGGVEYVGRGIGPDPSLAVVSALTSAVHQLLFEQRRLET
ncbi:hypothetical protein, partial [Escherichia coli]|uniref:hypothetical protein n=1 Tax=Escherichia coli TaxID=562 RepID=UPI0034D74753